MGLRLEIKPGHLSPLPHLLIVLRAGTQWHALMGQIRNPKHEVVKPILDFRQRCFSFSEFLSNAFHFLHERSRISAEFLSFTDRTGKLILFPLELLESGKRLATLPIQRGKLLPSYLCSPGADPLLDCLELITENFNIQHERIP